MRVVDGTSISFTIAEFAHIGGWRDVCWSLLRVCRGCSMPLDDVLLYWIACILVFILSLETYFSINFYQISQNYKKQIFTSLLFII
jgi:hypothetical protein